MKKTSKNKRLSFLMMLLMVFTISIILPTGAQEVKAAKAGFKTVAGKTYYIRKNGTKKKGWLTLNGKTYYFDKKTGVMSKGWEYDENGLKTRFFNTKTGVMFKGFVTNKAGNTRYFDPETGLVKRGWLRLNGKRYYFAGDEAFMIKGYYKTGNNSRYFDKKTGAMLVGFQKVGKYYYYFDTKSGVRFGEGFLTIDGKQYYFNTNGRAQTGWLTVGKRKYYFGSNAVMYVNRTATIDSKFWKFNSRGYATQSEYIEEGSRLKVYDEKNQRYYYMAREYATHLNIVGKDFTDRDWLAAIIDAEASDQGLTGMTAVGLCILNRTIKVDKEFPSEVRYVIYHTLPNSGYPQYTPVRNGALVRRLNGNFEEKTLSYQAADKAIKMFNNYVKRGKPRKLDGFAKSDFNYMYFMMTYSFWSQSLNFGRVDYCHYGDHTFFVDWV